MVWIFNLNFFFFWIEFDSIVTSFSLRVSMSVLRSSSVHVCLVVFPRHSATELNFLSEDVELSWGEVIGGEIGQDEAVGGNTNYCCTCWDCLETCDCNEDIVSVRDRILQFSSFMIIICKVIYFLVMVYESAVHTKTLSNCRTIIHYLHIGLFTLYLSISWPTGRVREYREFDISRHKIPLGHQK